MAIIAHVEIPVTDLDRAMAFYQIVFDVTFAEVITLHGNTMALFPFSEGQDGASIALAQGDVYVPTKEGAIVYFSVGDIDIVLSRAVDQGSEVLFPKTVVGDSVTVAEISDSEGNRIALQMM